MKLDPTALERATEAYIRELTQRPDQVVGDFVAAIVRAYLAADPDLAEVIDVALDIGSQAHSAKLAEPGDFTLSMPLLNRVGKVLATLNKRGMVKP